MKNILILVLSSLFFQQVEAQSGSITGKIIDEITGEDLVGAIVQIESLGLGAATDLFGSYKISKIPAGEYEIFVNYISYQSKKVTGIVVEENKVTSVDITLSSSPIETGTVEITDYKITNSEASVLIEMKEAKGVLSGISAAQIAKSQDRDASEVARRIPGVTVVDNRFVIVRGLSERYNAVMINNALAPSMETDVKTFSFDIIPSGMIDRFLIYKSPSADLPGEFAGGAIKVFTKNFPSKNFEVTLNQSFGYRSATTGENFRFNNRGDKDWLAMNDGSRALPSDFPDKIPNATTANSQQVLNTSKSLENTWGEESEKAPLDWRTSFSIGKKWKKEFGEIGIMSAVNYSRTRTSFLSEVGVYNVYDTLLNESDTVTYFYDSTFQSQTRLGFLLNVGVKIGTHHRLELKSFTNQNAQTEDTFRRGKDIEASNYRKEYFFNYNHRFITTNQLFGNHEIFGDKGVLDWTAGYSEARSEDPDWKRIRYTDSWTDETPGLYQAYVPAFPDPNYTGRIFLKMNETTRMFALNLDYKILKTKVDLEGKDQFISIKTGTYLEDKNRIFSIRSLGYKAYNQFQLDYDLTYLPLNEILASENMSAPNGFILAEGTKPEDSYSATNNLKAYYLKTTIPYKRWVLDAGLRIEDNNQALVTSDVQGKVYNIIKDSTILLPSANLSYNITKKSLVRAAYGVTVNRPEFRELAPFSFYDYKRNAILTGNPDLKFAVINNYDIRWELYPNAGEIVSFGVFYKDFTNPIELYFQPGVGSGGTVAFISGNAFKAKSYGLELDSRKNLGTITDVPIIKNLTLVANFSLIQSQIELSSKQSESANAIKSERPMMGQSPYIINSGLFYQNDSLDFSISAMYNVIGERVVAVGVPGVPEVWEMPRNLVDLTLTKGVGKYVDIRFGIQDLLNQKTLWIQDANGDGKLNRDSDQVYNSFRRGAYFTFGIILSLKSEK